jgi:hypothetical protein
MAVEYPAFQGFSRLKGERLQASGFRIQASGFRYRLRTGVGCIGPIGPIVSFPPAPEV